MLCMFLSLKLSVCGSLKKPLVRKDKLNLFGRSSVINANSASNCRKSLPVAFIAAVGLLAHWTECAVWAAGFYASSCELAVSEHRLRATERFKCCNQMPSVHPRLVSTLKFGNNWPDESHGSPPHLAPKPPRDRQRSFMIFNCCGQLFTSFPGLCETIKINSLRSG